jgi:two-component system, OmpR family, sensor kinase
MANASGPWFSRLLSKTRSLRWRIQAWYSGILALSLLVISVLLLWETSRSMWDDVDTDLLAGTKLIDGAMRRLPPEVLESFSPELAFRRGPLHRPPPNGPFREGRDPFREDFREGGRRPRGEPRGEAPGNGVERRPPPPPDLGDAPFPPPRSDAWLRPARSIVNSETSPSPENWPPEREAFEHSVDWRALERMAPFRLSFEDSKAYSLVWSSDGKLLHQSRMPAEFDTASALPTLGERNDRVLRQMRGPYRELLMRGLNGTTICVGMDASREIARMQRYSMFLLLAGLTVFVIGMLGGNWCLRRTLEPMHRMQATSQTIRVDDLQTRFDISSMDSEVAEVAGSINGMLDRLQHGFEQQKQFTADASHELRTPLAILLSSTELALSRERSPEAYRKELEKCQRAAVRMHNLVDSLLTLSRLDANESPPPLHSVDLKRLCEEQIEFLRDLATQKGIALDCELEPCSLQGDLGSLERLVGNLILNAIHYNSPAGTVRVQLACPPSSHHARLSITDTGIGIPAEDIPNLFKRFYRVDKARSRTQGGSGLGLAICEAVVQRHRGTLTVESAVDIGSTFTVTLPLEAADSPTVGT